MKLILSHLGLILILNFFPFLTDAQGTTFRVDMSVQIAIGRYNPSNDLLQVRGPFNGWSGTDLTIVAGSDSVYEAEIDIFEADGAQS
jgi:hypothetical protein